MGMNTPGPLSKKPNLEELLLSSAAADEDRSAAKTSPASFAKHQKQE